MKTVEDLEGALKELEDANDWWNGMYIVVVDKTQEGAGARLL